MALAACLQAAYTIQAALSGHRARRKQMSRFADDNSSEVMEEDDDDVFLIQSSLKGHHARLEQMKHMRLQRLVKLIYPWTLLYDFLFVCVLVCSYCFCCLISASF